MSCYIRTDYKNSQKLFKVTSGQDRVTGTGFTLLPEAMTVTTTRQECMKQHFSTQSNNEQCLSLGCHNKVP